MTTFSNRPDVASADGQVAEVGDAILPSPQPGLVALIGPPASGKSTVSRAIVKQCGATLFRLRTFAATYLQAHPEDAGLFDTDDRFGWFADRTVHRLLMAAFVEGMVKVDGLVVLEGFPGTAAQLQMIVSVADGLRLPLALVELEVSDSTVTSRAAVRRVCSGCDPIDRTDPRQPAEPAAGNLAQCARCQSPLMTRRADEPAVFQARLGRYRLLRPAIATAAAAVGLPTQQIMAQPEPPLAVNAVLAALRTIQPFEALLPRASAPVCAEGVPR